MNQYALQGRIMRYTVILSLDFVSCRIPLHFMLMAPAEATRD